MQLWCGLHRINFTYSLSEKAYVTTIETSSKSSGNASNTFCSYRSGSLSTDCNKINKFTRIHKKKSAPKHKIYTNCNKQKFEQKETAFKKHQISNKKKIIKIGSLSRKSSKVTNIRKQYNRIENLLLL